MNDPQSTNSAPTTMTDLELFADREEMRVFTNSLYRTRLHMDAWPMNLDSIIGAEPPSSGTMEEGLDPRGAAFSTHIPMQIELHPQIVRPNLRSTSSPTPSKSSQISRFGKNTANDDKGSTATLNTEGGSDCADVNEPRSLGSLVSTHASLSDELTGSRAGARSELRQGIEGGVTTDRHGNVTRRGSVVSRGTSGGMGMGVLIKGSGRAPAQSTGTEGGSISTRGGSDVSRFAARRKSSESDVSQSTMGVSGSTQGTTGPGVRRDGSGDTQMCSRSGSSDSVVDEADRKRYAIAVLHEPPMATGMGRIDPPGFEPSAPVSLWERQGSEVESWNPSVKKLFSVFNAGEQERLSHVPENSIQFRPSDVARRGWDRVTTAVTSHWGQVDRFQRWRSERRRYRGLQTRPDQAKRRGTQMRDGAKHGQEGTITSPEHDSVSTIE